MNRAASFDALIRHYWKRWHAHREALEEVNQAADEDAVPMALLLLRSSAERRRTIRRYLFSRFGVQIRDTMREEPFTLGFSRERRQFFVRMSPDYHPTRARREVRPERLPRNLYEQYQMARCLEEYALADMAYFAMMCVAGELKEIGYEPPVVASEMCRRFAQVHGARAEMAAGVVAELARAGAARDRTGQEWLKLALASTTGLVRSRMSLGTNKRLKSALGLSPADKLLAELPAATLLECAGLRPGDGVGSLVNRVARQLEKEGSEPVSSSGESPDVIGGEDEDLTEFERRETLRQDVDRLRGWVEEAEFSPSERIVYEFDLRIGTDFATKAEATKAAARALNDEPVTVRALRKRYRDKIRKAAKL